MLKHNRTCSPTAPGLLGTALRAAVFVLVGTGVSTVPIGCQSAPAPDETGPVRVVLEEVGLAFSALPDDCTRVEPSELAMELVCELTETTKTPAGPPGQVWLELDEPTPFGIELDDVAKSHRSFFLEMPGGEFFGGRQLIGPLGQARYTRGRFQAGDGATHEQIRVFTLHPLENRLVTLVSEYPAADEGDSRGRRLQVLLLLEYMDIDTPAPAAEAEARN